MWRPMWSRCLAAPNRRIRHSWSQWSETRYNWDRSSRNRRRNHWWKLGKRMMYCSTVNAGWVGRVIIRLVWTGAYLYKLCSQSGCFIIIKTIQLIMNGSLTNRSLSNISFSNRSLNISARRLCPSINYGLIWSSADNRIRTSIALSSFVAGFNRTSIVPK